MKQGEDELPMGHYAEEDENGVVWVYVDRRCTMFMHRRDWDQIVASLDSKATVQKRSRKS